MIIGSDILVRFASILVIALRGGAAECDDHGPVERSSYDVHRRLFDDRPAILDPVFAQFTAADRDIAILYTGSRLMAYDAVKDDIVWQRGIDPPVQPEFLGQVRGRMLFLAPTYVFSIAAATGRDQWRWGDAAKNDPAADPEWTPQWVDRLLTAERLVVVDDRGNLSALDIEDGSLSWRRADGPRKPGRLAARGGLLAWLASTQTGDVLSIAELSDGGNLRQHGLAEAASMQMLLWPTNNRLLLAAAGRITAIHAETLAESWRVGADDRFWTPTLQADSRAVYVSGDGRRMTRYNLADGDETWTTAPLARSDEGGLWCRLREGTLYSSSNRGLAAIDWKTGKSIWKRPLRRWQLLQSPIVTQAGLLCVSRTTVGPAPVSQSASATEDRETWHRIELAAFAAGKQGWTLRIEPIESFGGMSAGDNWVLLVDGRQLIGYVRRP